ncbi:MAG: putative toxin-antitoxin system toxin component, PIN family [Burkholderiales bacterium]
MRVVLDTNVLISAALRNRLPEQVFKTLIGRNDWFWLVTQSLLAEYERVLRRPALGIPRAHQDQWLQLARDHAALVDAPEPTVEFARDRKDIHVLHAAMAGAADYLITGDKDFAEAQRLVTTRIVSVAEFARLFGIT